MDYTCRENNNFNLIRMIAAYMVIFAHATAIQGNGIDIIARITGQTHSGQMAVFIFTFLSGVFITKSVMNTDLKEFCKKRICRLYPELIVCLIVTLSIGAIFTTCSFSDYWTNPQVKKYFIANLLEITNEHFLPGVFVDHPVAGAMNGVLWFITFEVRIYFLYGILKSLQIFEDRIKSNLVIILLLVWVIAKPSYIPFLGGNGELYGNVNFPQYTITFFIASLFYINFKEINVKWEHLCGWVCLMYIFRHSSIAIWIWGAGFILFAMYFGTRKILLGIKIKDLSYGIFLYGWPIGQVVYELLPKISAFYAAIITAIVATIVALGSEKLIAIAYRISKNIKGDQL